MKKISYFTIAAIAMLVFSLVSCKKELPQSSSTTSSIKSSFVQVKDGRLVFKSIAELDSQIVALNVHHEELYESWESSINFKSYRTLERKAILANWNNYYVNRDSLAPMATYVEVSPFYLNVLNENREVMVNDSVYFINGSNLFIIPYESETQLKTTEKSIDNQIISENTFNQKSVESNVRYVQLKINGANFTNHGNLKDEPVPNNYNFSSEEWKTNGFSFKYIFEVQWSNYMTNGTHGIQVAVSNYLVYWQSSGGRWLIAGQPCYKTYSYTTKVFWSLWTPVSEDRGLGWEYDNTFASQSHFISNPYGDVPVGFSVSGTAQDYTIVFVKNPYSLTSMNFKNGTTY